MVGIANPERPDDTDRSPTAAERSVGNGHGLFRTSKDARDRARPTVEKPMTDAGSSLCRVRFPGPPRRTGGG